MWSQRTEPGVVSENHWMRPPNKEIKIHLKKLLLMGMGDWHQRVLPET